MRVPDKNKRRNTLLRRQRLALAGPMPG